MHRSPLTRAHGWTRRPSWSLRARALKNRLSGHGAAGCGTRGPCSRSTSLRCGGGRSRWRFVHGPRTSLGHDHARCRSLWRWRSRRGRWCRRTRRSRRGLRGGSNRCRWSRRRRGRMRRLTHRRSTHWRRECRSSWFLRRGRDWWFRRRSRRYYGRRR